MKTWNLTSVWKINDMKTWKHVNLKNTQHENLKTYVNLKNTRHENLKTRQFEKYPTWKPENLRQFEKYEIINKALNENQIPFPVRWPVRKASHYTFQKLLMYKTVKRISDVALSARRSARFTQHTVSSLLDQQQFFPPFRIQLWLQLVLTPTGI